MYEIGDQVQFQVLLLDYSQIHELWSVSMRRFFRVPVTSFVIATLERELTRLPLPRLEAKPRNKPIFMLN